MKYQMAATVSFDESAAGNRTISKSNYQGMIWNNLKFLSTQILKKFYHLKKISSFSCSVRFLLQSNLISAVNLLDSCSAMTVHGIDRDSHLSRRGDAIDDIFRPDCQLIIRGSFDVSNILIYFTGQNCSWDCQDRSTSQRKLPRKYFHGL